jgi:hypothetical protein
LALPSTTKAITANARPVIHAMCAGAHIPIAAERGGEMLLHNHIRPACYNERCRHESQALYAIHERRRFPALLSTTMPRAYVVTEVPEIGGTRSSAPADAHG